MLTNSSPHVREKALSCPEPLLWLPGRGYDPGRSSPGSPRPLLPRRCRPWPARNLARKRRQPGQRLSLESTSITRAENAGRAIGPGGSVGSGPVVPGPRGAGKASTVSWHRCGAGCFGTPTSPSSTAPTMAGIACRPACWPRRCCSTPATRWSDAEAKARADFDIRWKSLPPATTGGGLGD